MKAILEFNLPDEASEYKTFNNASKYYSVIWALAQHLRSKLKFEDLDESESLAYQKVRDKLYEFLNDESIADEF